MNRPAVSIPLQPNRLFESLQAIVETQKTTVVAVTHDMDLAARMQRRVHLVDGRIDYDRVQS